METQLLSSTQESIRIAANALTHGELVAFPTETVYGLGARIFDESAIQKIFTVKGRPSDNPLIAHIATVSEVEKIATAIPPLFYTIAEHFFPGPLTVILQKKSDVPASVSAGLSSIAVRMPNHPVALALITAVGEPLVAPSANVSGKPSPTTAQHVYDDLHGTIAAIIDGGACQVGIESTVIDIRTSDITILRPGIITKEQIEAVVHLPVTYTTNTDGAVSSPGMKYKHYAPHARVTITHSWEETTKQITGTPLILSNIPHPTIAYIPYSEATLFTQFREADKQGLDEIIIIVDKETEKKAGLMNRIRKAASTYERTS